MPSPRKAQEPRPSGIPAAGLAAFRFVASSKLAVVLLVVLAVVLAAGTLVERSKGTEYVQWCVYQSDWFLALWALLGANIAAATLIRLPWIKCRPGFFVTHLGVLVVMGGAIQTHYGGIEGRLRLAEGETGNSIQLGDRSTFTVVRQTQDGKAEAQRRLFSFRPGPENWPDGKTLDLGQLGGVSLKVLKLYRHASTEVSWVKDESGQGEPALRLALSGPDGEPVADRWLVADRFSLPAAIGPVKFEVQSVPVASLLDEFLNPPAGPMDQHGVLSMHYAGKVQRIPVSENLGKKTSLGDGAPAVEIVEYLPNAVASSGGRLGTQGDQPDNPALELRVYQPGSEQPRRQITFANYSLLNLDGMHGWNCPVKFFYHHPAASAREGVKFLRTPDGKFHCLEAADGKYKSHGAVQKGDAVDLSGKYKASILASLASARRQVDFYPVETGPGERSGLEAAALVEVSADGTTQQAWLGRTERDDAWTTMATPQALIGVRFGYERLPLSFSLRLLDFERGLNPGGMGNASFTSRVEVIDQENKIGPQQEITMNEPLKQDKFTIYQSGYDPAGGASVSILGVTYDPGRLLKYVGSLLVCLGCLLMISMKTPLANRLAWVLGRRSSTPLSAILALLVFAVPAAADELSRDGFDWAQWRSLPVQAGGRTKPLDTFARESLRALSDRTSLVEAESGRTLEPTALYLTLIFEWQGWDQPQDPHGTVAPESVLNKNPDRWDRTPLLPVDSRELREALGLPAGEKYIAPLELSKAQIRDPQTSRKTPFLSWARKFAGDEAGEPTAFQREAADLANGLMAYQAHRMGRILRVAPLQDSKHQEWLPLATLLRTKLDDTSDPTGELRKAQTEFKRARAAYQADSAEDFNAASAAFVVALEEAGPHLGVYPSQRTIDLEVDYNRFVPFRLAWMAMGVALVALLVSAGTGRRLAYAAGLVAFIAGLAATLVGFGMRAVIVGWVPVTNMYESVLCVAAGAALFGLVFALRYRRQFVLTAAAVVATVALVLADTCPTILDPTIKPIAAVLRSNYWLVIHVVTIMLSYAAFALAWVVGNVVLGYYAAHSPNRETIVLLSKVTLKTVQTGVLLLLAGTILGAMWADDAWGRFWGWDSKEVWALITLLGYLAVLHARPAGWAGQFGLVAWSVLCFSLVLMAWYGVNFVLGTGMHSYGFGGGGGQYYVGAAVLVQWLLVLGATIRAASWSVPADVLSPDASQPAPEAPRRPSPDKVAS